MNLRRLYESTLSPTVGEQVYVRDKKSHYFGRVGRISEIENGFGGRRIIVKFPRENRTEVTFGDAIENSGYRTGDRVIIKYDFGKYWKRGDEAILPPINKLTRFSTDDVPENMSGEMLRAETPDGPIGWKIVTGFSPLKIEGDNCRPGYEIPASYIKRHPVQDDELVNAVRAKVLQTINEYMKSDSVIFDMLDYGKILLPV